LMMLRMLRLADRLGLGLLGPGLRLGLLSGHLPIISPFPSKLNQKTLSVSTQH